MTTPRLPAFPQMLLILSLAFAGLYVRSYWRTDALALFVSDGKLQALVSSRGRLVGAATNLAFGCELRWSWDFVSVPNEEGSARVSQLLDTRVPPLQKFGFAAASNPIDQTAQTSAAMTSYRLAAVPDWVLLSPLGIFTLSRLWGWSLPWRRGRRGLCRYCGYDIRGQSERCPECGNAVAGKYSRLPVVGQ